MKSEKADNPKRLDVKAMIEQGRTLSGASPLAAMPRLMQSVMASATEPEAAVAWEANGELRESSSGVHQHWLSLRADADLALVCQRCLGPVREHVLVDRWLRFVDDEAEAAALDAELDDDVLAWPRWLDLLELIEDEMLLALPLVPRHAVCPQPLVPAAAADAEAPADAASEEAEPHPFAALASLRGKLGK